MTMTTMKDMMTKTDVDHLFVYSEVQLNENNAIAKRKGRKFIVGQIYEGSNTKTFTKIIKESELSSMSASYPDVRIVAKGNKFKMKYTLPQFKLDI